MCIIVGNVSKCECISLAKTVTLYYYTVVYHVWLRLIWSRLQSTCYMCIIVDNVSKCECISLAKTLTPYYMCGCVMFVKY